MAHERVEEARDVVKHIKDTHLMTWTNEEWDAWVREHAGGRRDDALYLLGKIREAWGRDWPMVDFEGFMESYRMFGRDGVGGLRALLTPSRNRKGERLMENGGDNVVLRAVMRVVMGIGGEGDLDVLRRERVVGKGWVPGGEGGVTLEELDGVPEAGVILMFFMSSYREGDFRPVLLQYDETRGDGGDSRGWLDAGFIDRVHKVLAGLHGGEGLVREPPLVEALYTELRRRAYDGKRLVRMDLANFICGSLGNISALCNSGEMAEANREVEEMTVALGFVGESWWMDDKGGFWRLSSEGVRVRMVRFSMSENKYKTFFLQVYRDGTGSLHGYIFTYDEGERLFNGGDIMEVSTFATVNLSDAGGRALIDDIRAGDIEVMEFGFVNNRRADDFRVRSLRRVARNNAAAKGSIDRIKEKIEKGERRGESRVYTAETEIEAENERLMRCRCAMLSANCIFVPCEVEDPDECEVKGDERGWGMRVKTWFRVPRFKVYRNLTGEEVSLGDVSLGECPVWQRMRRRGVEGWRDVLFFATLNIIVDVTDVMHPRVGMEMPQGIMLVRSPTVAVAPSDKGFVCVEGARVEERGGGLVMRVEYVARCYDALEEVRRSWCVDEELVVYGGG